MASQGTRERSNYTEPRQERRARVQRYSSPESRNHYTTAESSGRSHYATADHRAGPQHTKPEPRAVGHYATTSERNNNTTVERGHYSSVPHYTSAESSRPVSHYSSGDGRQARTAQYSALQQQSKPVPHYSTSRAPAPHYSVPHKIIYQTDSPVGSQQPFTKFRTRIVINGDS